MKTTNTITFVASTSGGGGDGGSGGSGSHNVRLLHLSEDNVDPIVKYKDDYFKANGEYPSLMEESYKNKYLDLLEESYTAASRQLLRFYSSNLKTYSIVSVRAKSAKTLSTKSESLTEEVAITNSTSARTAYPVSSVTSMHTELMKQDGSTYTGGYEVDDGGNINFTEEVSGFIRVGYTHKYALIQVECLEKKALNKTDSVITVVQENAQASAVVAYPDVQDDVTGVAPDSGTTWKIRIKEGLQQFYPSSSPWSNEWVEKARTLSPVEIEGVKIDRALTVTFENDLDDTLKLIFDLPPEVAP